MYISMYCSISKRTSSKNIPWDEKIHLPTQLSDHSGPQVEPILHVVVLRKYGLLSNSLPAS